VARTSGLGEVGEIGPCSRLGDGSGLLRMAAHATYKIKIP
jgi:hypothetical protein